MPQVTLKLSMGTFSVEVSGPAEYAERKLEELVGRYLSSAKPSVTEPRVSTVAIDKGGKKLAAAEFLRKVGPRNQSDRALTLAYYLEQTDKQSAFTTTELRDLSKKAKYPFTNISDTVAKLVSRGLMMSSGDKDGQRAYALTASGEEYVESLTELKR